MPHGGHHEQVLHSPHCFLMNPVSLVVLNEVIPKESFWGTMPTRHLHNRCSMWLRMGTVHGASACGQWPHRSCRAPDGVLLNTESAATVKWWKRLEVDVRLRLPTSFRMWVPTKRSKSNFLNPDMPGTRWAEQSEVGVLIWLDTWSTSGVSLSGKRAQKLGRLSATAGSLLCRFQPQ